MLATPSRSAALLASLIAALSAAAPAAQSAPPPPLSEALAALCRDPALSGARVGAVVLDGPGGSTVVEHDADFGFMTASNMKLVVAATALATLGPEFRFRTRLVATGPVRDGVLHGDLVLIGSGDPSLGAGDDALSVFGQMLDGIGELRALTGHVVGDDDCQPDEVMGDGWAWGYAGEDYAAQVSGLCFAENCITLEVRPRGDGEAPDVALIPPTGYCRVENLARSVAGEGAASLWVQRQRASNVIRVGGTLRVGIAPTRHRCSVENPTAWAATALRETLLARGVQVGGGAFDRDELPAHRERYGDETLLAEHESPTLSELLVTLMKRSQNLYAEQLVRAASRARGGDGGMGQAAAHSKATLAALGVDTAGMRVADGSGLTRLNLVRPRQLAALLAAMWQHDYRAMFVDSLPIAGVDGTLKGRFHDSPARGRVRAKTGYVSSVVALSGYVQRGPEHAAPMVFSVLVNNFTCETRAAQRAVDRFVEAIATHAGWR